MFNRKVISAIIGASALMAASSAFADIALPSTGNGELALFVTDTGTGNSYVKGLGVTMDSILTNGNVATTPAGDIGYSLPTVNLSSDSAFTSLISGATGTIIWGVMGADSVGSNLVSAPRRLVLTSGGVVSNAPSNTTISGTTADIESYFNSVNGNIPGATAGDLASVAGTGNTGGMFGNAGTAGAAATGGFTSGIGLSGSLGNTLNFYMFTSSNTSGLASAGGGNAGKAFTLASLTLTSAGLSSVSSVPLPAGVWLLGSGLLGMFGVGRRRALKA
jgi:hypothetical protein